MKGWIAGGMLALLAAGPAGAQEARPGENPAWNAAVAACRDYVRRNWEPTFDAFVRAGSTYVSYIGFERGRFEFEKCMNNTPSGFTPAPMPGRSSS